MSLLGLLSSGHNTVKPPAPWVTDGIVYASDVSGNTIYIGGRFSYLFPNVQYGAPLDAATGMYKTGIKKRTLINGNVFACAPDGSGGWYIGGNFTTVNGTARTSVARINANGTLHDWNPALNGGGVIRAITVSGGRVYLGGTFSITIAGIPYLNLAVVDTATGAPIPGWVTQVTSGGATINDIAVSGSTIIIGGSFSTVDDALPPVAAKARLNLAALDSTGAVIPTWIVDAAGTTQNVYALAVSGNRLFVGGEYTSLGGQIRNNLGEVDIASGAVSSNTFDADNTVRSLSLYGNMLYAAGDFQNITGSVTVPCHYCGAINISSNTIDASWDPYPSGSAYKIAATGQAVYIAGGFFFVNMGGTAVRRNCMAAVAPANGANTGVATSFDTNADDAVFAVAASGTTVYAGGVFTAISRVPRMNCAAINALTGRPTPWNPTAGNTPNTVFAVKAAGSRVYIGGNFTTVGNPPQAQNYLAAVTPAGTPIPSWNTNPASGIVHAIEASSDTVYIGGEFLNIIALNASDGAVKSLPWVSPSLAHYAFALLLSGNMLYIGTGVAGIAGDVSAVNAATGGTTGFAIQSFNSTVYTLALSGNRLFVGGEFSTRLAQLNALDGLPNAAWTPYTDSTVSALCPSGNMLFIGGGFNNINGSSQPYLGAVLTVDPGILNTEFTPTITGGGFQILTLKAVNGIIYGGGYFYPGGSPVAQGFAAFDPQTGDML